MITSDCHVLRHLYACISSCQSAKQSLIRAARIQVCPFFATKSLAEDADIVFMPYNYVTEDVASMHKLLAGSVLILDEAHNVESVCQDTASFDLSSGACLRDHSISPSQYCLYSSCRSGPLVSLQLLSSGVMAALRWWFSLYFTARLFVLIMAVRLWNGFAHPDGSHRGEVGSFTAFIKR